jgi:hypothetical protein
MKTSNEKNTQAQIAKGKEHRAESNYKKKFLLPFVILTPTLTSPIGGRVDIGKRR